MRRIMSKFSGKFVGKFDDSKLPIFKVHGEDGQEIGEFSAINAVPGDLEKNCEIVLDDPKDRFVRVM